MIKEQSCPSCTMASTTCDQSWGPSVPGTVHHAAKQLWCLTSPSKSEAANPPESTVCPPLKPMTHYAPWVPRPGVHQAIPEGQKKRRPDTQATLSLCSSLESLTQQPQFDNQTVYSDTTIFLQIHEQTFWCVCDSSMAWHWDVWRIQAPSCYELIALLF